MSWRSLVLVVALAAVGLVAWLMLRETVGKPLAPVALLFPQPSGAVESDTPPTTPSTQPSRSRIQARPFRESDQPPTEPAPPITGEIVVTVVDGDNHPIAGAAVSPTSIGGEAFSWRMERTNPEGAARVGLQTKHTHVVVTAPGYPPVLTRIEDRNAQRVVLWGEVTLRGRALVNGGVPPGPIALTVRGYEDPSDTWPEPAKTIVGRHEFGETRLLVDTDPKGEFAVRGPARGASVTIGIPEGYRFADSTGGAMRRETPAVCNAEMVVLDLTAMKAITGRVIVDPRTGGADLIEYSRDIEIRYTLARSGSPPIAGSLQAWMGERFAIYHSAPFVDGIDVQVWSRLRRRYGGKQLQERITGSKDLGDIVIEELPWVVFRVTDPSGRPIPDARVFVEGFVSEPSNAEGRTGNEVPKWASSVIAGAPRFKLARVRLPESLPATVDIRLEPSVTLVVRVRHEDPSVELRSLRVALSFDVDESVVASTGRWEFNDVRGTVPYGGGGTGNRQTRNYGVRPGEDIVVSGFSSGDMIEVRVEDQYWHVLLNESIKLPEDETHAIEMVVRSAPRTIRGTVLDDQGHPLTGARVGVVGAWMDPSAPGTDGSGKFQIDNAYGEAVSLSVSAPGHVGRTVRVDKLGEPITIQLERARQLAVTLTGPATAPFQGQVTFEITGGETYHASSRGERLSWFAAIPCKPGTVRVSGSAGQSSTAAIGAEETRVSVPIPE